MKYWKYLAGAVILILLIAWSFVPRPANAELAVVSRGTLTQTVEEDGRTRVVDRYEIVAPIAGKLLRIEHRPGYEVQAGETILATIVPADSALLDKRGLAEAEAAVKRARAGIDKAKEELNRATQAKNYADRELKRLQRLAAEQTISRQRLDAAENDAKLRSADERAAKQAVSVARFNLEQARAALLQGSGDRGNGALEIIAPIDGKVFQVYRESEGFVTAGTPLLQLGDPAQLEVVVDLLSQEAVKVLAGQDVLLEHWGGEQPLAGKVRLVEPSGFTKISALGVEEQRVNAVIDLIDPPETWKGLADGFRVEVKILVWQEDDVLLVPSSALFRQGDGWATFTANENKVSRVVVEAGRRNSLFVQVEKGLAEGDQVIVHPSDQIKDGVQIKTKPAP